MDDVIRPAIRKEARALVEEHRTAGDLLAIITATNRFVTAPIAQAFGIDHLIAAEPELTADGDVTGRLLGTPPFGAGKVTNTHAWLASLGKKLDDFGRSTFYSDSQNDIPLPGPSCSCLIRTSNDQEIHSPHPRRRSAR